MSDQQRKPMSHSRMNSILGCGWRYYLERVLKKDSRPSWATVGGGAVHTVIEAELRKRWERDHGQPGHGSQDGE